MNMKNSSPSNEEIMDGFRPGRGVLVPPKTPCVVTGAYWGENGYLTIAKLIVVIGNNILQEEKYRFWNKSDWPDNSLPKGVNFIYTLPLDGFHSDETREILCRYGTSGDGFMSTRDEEDHGTYKLYKRYFNASSNNTEIAEFKFQFFVGHDLPF